MAKKKTVYAKSFLLLCLASLPLWLFSACMGKKQEISLEKAIPGNEIEPKFFCLKTEFEAYPPGTDQIYCILSRYCGQQLYYGCQTGIEVLLEGEWYTLPYGEKASFNAVLHGAKGAGELSFDEVFLSMYDYEFPEGTYRVVFPCCLEEYEPHKGKGFDRVMYAEFQIRADAKRQLFCDIEEQSLEPGQALEDGCVVLRDGGYENEGQAETFIWKSSLGIPCQMRLVDCEEGVVKDVSYQRLFCNVPQVYTLTTRKGEETESRKYAFLGSRTEHGRTEVVLSSYPYLKDVWEMGMGFRFAWDVEAVMAQEEGQEPEWYQDWVEKIRRSAAYKIENGTPGMTVSNRAGTKWMNLSFWQDADETKSSMDLEIYEENGMYVKERAESYRIWKRDYPVYIFPVGEEDFGVLFQLTNGSYGARRYSGESGRVIKRLYGEWEELISELAGQKEDE